MQAKERKVVVENNGSFCLPDRLPLCVTYGYVMKAYAVQNNNKEVSFTEK